MRNFFNPKKARTSKSSSDTFSPEDLLNKLNPSLERANFDKLKQNEQDYKPPFQCELSLQLPFYTASLRVVAEGTKYRLFMYDYSRKTPKITDLFEQPIGVSLGKIQIPNNNHTDSNQETQETLAQLRQILGSMHEFSEENPAAKSICDWLNELEETNPQKINQHLSHIVINDETDCEIPWEMLPLAKDKYLGASFVAVRWQDIPNINPEWCNSFNNSISIEDFKTFHCCGDIVAYTDKVEVPQDTANKPKETLSQFKEFNDRCFDNINGFLDNLHNNSSKVSMIFVHCHGYFGDDITQMWLGKNQLPKERVYLTEMNDKTFYDFEFLSNEYNSSIVFMNACHSGRLRKDNRNICSKDYRKGFATFFLKKGAKGVIGSLGKLSNKYALKITQVFFNKYLEEDKYKLPVAEILKELRQEAIDNLKADKTWENRYILLFTFMYVYYGNPKTILQLTPLEG
jgi:CHAT domain-containing protein